MADWRDEIHMGAWKAAYMFDDYTRVYHRVWDYTVTSLPIGGLTSGRVWKSA